MQQALMKLPETLSNDEIRRIGQDLIPQLQKYLAKNEKNFPYTSTMFENFINDLKDKSNTYSTTTPEQFKTLLQIWENEFDNYVENNFNSTGLN